MTPMHKAIQMENIEVLQHMVSNVAHVEQRDASGSTLLHVAASKRQRDICTILLEERHADPNVIDHNNMTPLHKCQTNNGGIQVAELLLRRCPDLIDCVDVMGKTALYMACEKGNTKMVKYLLSQGQANPDIQGPGKRTPLIVAIDLAAQDSQKIRIVEQLLKHGADPSIGDADGRTAFMAARNAGLAASEIRRMLNSVPPRRKSTATTNSASSSSRRNTSSNIGGIYSLAELALSR
ncbi:ankyrin repeat-containing domain protein [Daldinia bambusicola]|nr:ankyrin repeat-containing domain protein [Daldinia bambusicola]